MKPKSMKIIILVTVILNYSVFAIASEDVVAKVGEPFLLKAGESARIIDGNHAVIFKLINFSKFRWEGAPHIHIGYEMIIDGVLYSNGPKGTWPQGVPYDLFLGSDTGDYFKAESSMYFKDQTYIEIAVLDSVKVCQHPDEMNLPNNIRSYVEYLSRDKESCERRLIQRFFNFDYCYAPAYSASISQDECIVNVLDQIKTSERCKNVHSLFESKCIQALSRLDSSLCTSLKQTDVKKACFQKLSEIKNMDHADRQPR